MKKNTLIAAVLASMVAGSFAAPVMAQSAEGDRTERVQEQRGGRDHAKRGGRGEDRGRGEQMRGFFEAYDANEDGSLTQEEIDTVRAARLAAFDADGDSQLSLEEYQALWLDAMRERMVDQFQSHDDDGDGLVTAEEFGEQFANIVERRDRNGDGMLNEDDRRGGRAAAEEASE